MVKSREDRISELFEISGHLLQEQADLLNLSVKQWEHIKKEGNKIFKTIRPGRAFVQVLYIATHKELIRIREGHKGAARVLRGLNSDNLTEVFVRLRSINALREEIRQKLRGDTQ